MRLQFQDIHNSGTKRLTDWLFTKNGAWHHQLNHSASVPHFQPVGSDATHAWASAGQMSNGWISSLKFVTLDQKKGTKQPNQQKYASHRLLEIHKVGSRCLSPGQVWLAPRAGWHHGTMIPDCSQSSSAKSLGKVKQGLRWNGLLLLKNTI
jgi:hypothetical protein